VVSFTAVTDCIIQPSLDLTNLQTGDTINVKLSDSTTGTLAVFANDTFGPMADDPLAKGYMVALQKGDVYKMTLSQTAGTIRSFNYAYRVIANA